MFLHAFVVEANPPALPVWQSMGEAMRSQVQGQVPKSFGVFSRVFERVNQSVVNISTVQNIKQLGSSTEGTRKNLGSGGIISSDGYIVTNAHVIENERAIAVKLADGRVYRGKLVGSDEFTDLALVKIEAKEPLPILYLAAEDEVRVGSWVLAIGNPFGFHNTVTQGIVSAIGRVISDDERRKRFDDFIQIDASINPGNSGGPLVNLAGEVIGINTAMTSSGSGIAFAVPIRTVKRVLDDLVQYGRVKRGWLGVVVDSKEKDRPGLRVLQVVSGSPAEKAGLKLGDRVIRFGGQKVTTLHQFSKLVAQFSPTQKIKVQVVRAGDVIDLLVVLEEFSKRSFNAASQAQ